MGKKPLCALAHDDFRSIAVLPFCLATSPAGAQFYVRSPDVKKGELAIEEHGAVYSGPGEESGVGNPTRSS